MNSRKKSTERKPLTPPVNANAGVPPAPELPLPPTKGVAPLAKSGLPPTATAAQIAALLPLAEINETFLRNRAAGINPRTGAPWIPKPKRGRYELLPTLAGLAEWFYTAAESYGLPKAAGSMKKFEELFGWPVDVLQYASAHGAAEAFHSSGRVEVLTVIKFFGPLLQKLVTGGGAAINGLEGFEELDKDVMQARVLKQTEIEKMRTNALENNRLHDLRQCEQAIWLELLSPIRDDWQNIVKKFHRRKGAADPMTGDELMEDFTRVLEKICAAVDKKNAP